MKEIGWSLLNNSAFPWEQTRLLRIQSTLEQLDERLKSQLKKIKKAISQEVLSFKGDSGHFLFLKERLLGYKKIILSIEALQREEEKLLPEFIKRQRALNLFSCTKIKNMVERAIALSETIEKEESGAERIVLWTGLAKLSIKPSEVGKVKNLKYRLELAKVLLDFPRGDLSPKPKEALVQLLQFEATHSSNWRFLIKSNFLGVKKLSDTDLKQLAKNLCKKLIRFEERRNSCCKHLFDKINRLQNRTIAKALISRLAKKKPELPVVYHLDLKLLESKELLNFINTLALQWPSLFFCLKTKLQEEDFAKGLKIICRNDPKLALNHLPLCTKLSEETRLEVYNLLLSEHPEMIAQANLQIQFVWYNGYIRPNTCYSKEYQSEELNLIAEFAALFYEEKNRPETLEKRLDPSKVEQLILPRLYRIAEKSGFDKEDLDFLEKRKQLGPLLLVRLFFSFYCLLLPSKKNREAAKWLASCPEALRAICTYREFEKRDQIAAALNKALHSGRERALSIYGEMEKSKHLIPPILLAILHAQNKLGEEKAKELAAQISKNKNYRNNALLQPLIHSLLLLVNDAHRKKEVVEPLLTLLVPKTERTERKKKADLSEQLRYRELSETSKRETVKKSLLQQALAGIYAFSGEGRLTKERLEQPEAIEGLLEALFREKAPLEGVKDFYGKYFSTFGDSKKNRDPQALVRYAANAESWGEKTKKGLQIYISEVLNGDFQKNRYLPERSPHIKKLCRFGGGTLWKAWQLEKKKPLSALLVRGKEEKIDFKALLKEKLVDCGHLGGLKQNYTHLYRLLCLGEELERVESDLLEEIGGLHVAAEEKKRLKLQLFCLRLAQAEDEASALAHLTKIKRSLGGTKEAFNSDIAALIERYRKRIRQKQEGRFSGWSLVNTDNPYDLLLCGTEISGSCQHINSEPHLNKCLLSYLLDGKNRLLAVKDDSGRIQARAILRMLLEQEDWKPCLFLEKIYPKESDLFFKKALITMAELTAAELRLPLYRKVFEGPKSKKALRSLGSAYDLFEYVDALRGRTRGPYALFDQTLIFKPGVSLAN